MENKLITIKPIEKDLLYNKIADGILNYINENNLKHGDKIPSERILAEYFSTSRNSVREAIRILSNEQILEVKIGKGTFLLSDSTPKSVSVKLWKIDYEELLEMKNMLVNEIIRDLCARHNSLDLFPAEVALNTLEANWKLGVFSRSIDYNFHRSLDNLFHNSMLTQLIDNLISLLDIYGDNLKEDLHDVENIWCSTVPYHRVMFDGIKEGNVEKALLANKRIYELDLHALHISMNHGNQEE